MAGHPEPRVNIAALPAVAGPAAGIPAAVPARRAPTGVVVALGAVAVVVGLLEAAAPAASATAGPLALAVATVTA